MYNSDFKQKMTQIWPKRAIFEFYKKMRKSTFSTPKTRLSTKNEQILMNVLRKKCKKPPFLGIFTQNGQFWKFLAKMGKTGIFQKSLGKFLSGL